MKTKTIRQTATFTASAVDVYDALMNAMKHVAFTGADASIEKRLAEDGSVSYVRKEADAQGNVKFVSVQYDEVSNTFVNAAPKSATAGAASQGMVKKSCSASEAKACAGGAAKEGKACCAGKSAAACGKKEQ